MWFYIRSLGTFSASWSSLAWWAWRAWRGGITGGAGRKWWGITGGGARGWFSGIWGRARWPFNRTWGIIRRARWRFSRIWGRFRRARWWFCRIWRRWAWLHFVSSNSSALSFNRGGVLLMDPKPGDHAQDQETENEHNDLHLFKNYSILITCWTINIETVIELVQI